MLFGKWRPFCFGLNVLTHPGGVIMYISISVNKAIIGLDNGLWRFSARPSYLYKRIPILVRNVFILRWPPGRLWNYEKYLCCTYWNSMQFGWVMGISFMGGWVGGGWGVCGCVCVCGGGGGGGGVGGRGKRHYKMVRVDFSSDASLLIRYDHFDGLVQERRNSIANTLELHLSCTNPSMWK